MNQNELRLEIQRYAFAAHDMQLYLDTHPKDSKAFSIFKSLSKKASDLKNEFASKYAPLSPGDISNFADYSWIDGPWPWEKGGNQ